MAKHAKKHETLFFVYVLGSQRKNDRRTYVGWTTDLERRLQQHNAGVGAKSARRRKWTLLYSERCKTRNLSEKGETVSGRGDAVNMHDILTGSDPSGRFSTAGGDTTCGNWTKSGDGSAILGHHDRAGLKDTWHMRSWNSSHGSRGCSQEQLKSTGGAGLLYCFAAN